MDFDLVGGYAALVEGGSKVFYPTRSFITIPECLHPE
jgi:hypothetical protein